MNCEQFKKNIDAFIDCELSEEQHKQFQEHSEQCPSCAALYNSYNEMIFGLNDLGKIEFSVSEELHNKIMTGVNNAEKSSQTKRNSFSTNNKKYTLVAGILSLFVATGSYQTYKLVENNNIIEEPIIAITPDEKILEDIDANAIAQSQITESEDNTLNSETSTNDNAENQEVDNSSIGNDSPLINEFTEEATLQQTPEPQNEATTDKTTNNATSQNNSTSNNTASQNNSTNNNTDKQDNSTNNNTASQNNSANNTTNNNNNLTSNNSPTSDEANSELNSEVSSNTSTDVVEEPIAVAQEHQLRSNDNPAEAVVAMEPNTLNTTLADADAGADIEINLNNPDVVEDCLAYISSYDELNIKNIEDLEGEYLVEATTKDVDKFINFVHDYQYDGNDQDVSVSYNTELESNNEDHTGFTFILR